MSALKAARSLADDIQTSISSNNNNSVVVYPYSIFYVFYEQYLTIWQDTIINLVITISTIFIVTFIFLGFDLLSSVIIIATIASIVINLMGLMFWWDISLNGVSLVNLVMVIFFIRHEMIDMSTKVIVFDKWNILI